MGARFAPSKVEPEERSLKDRLVSTSFSCMVPALSLLLCLGCATWYRSAVPWSDDSPSAFVISSAGVRDASTGERSVRASERLARESGFPDVGAKLAPEDWGMLMANPARLAYASAWRHDLAVRIGYRHVLVGDVVESPVDESKEWVPGMGAPFAYARRSGERRPALALRGPALAA